MAGQVFAIEDARLKALAYLRTHGPATVDQIAAGLGMPDWAIRPALEAAQIADLAAPTADGVWGIAQQKVAA
jgi:hypothetical protein